MRRTAIKQTAILLIIAIAVFCFTGCVRLRSTVKIRGDGTSDITLLFAIKNSSYNDVADNLEEIIDSLESEGWETDVYNEDDFTGYTSTLRNVKLSEIEDRINSSGQLSEIGLTGFDISIEGSRYTMRWNTSELTSINGMEIPAGLFDNGGFIELVLDLPVKPDYYSQPTDISDDGKTLTWDLMQQPDIDIGFTLVESQSFRATFDVNDKGLTDISIVYACSEEEYEDLKYTYEGLPGQLESDDWSVDDYEDDGFIGCEFTIEDVPLDDVDDVLNDDIFEYIGFDTFEMKKKGGDYVVNWDTEGVLDDVLRGREFEDGEYEGFMEVIVNLPDKAKDNNATDESKNGRKLVWDLMEDQEVKFTYSSINIILIAAIAGTVFMLLLAGLVVVLIIVLKKKKGKKADKKPAPAAKPAKPVAPIIMPPAPGTVAKPVAPVAPAAPVASVTPVAPTAPVAPVATPAPAVPVASAAPVAPTAPAVVPAVPAAPVASVAAPAPAAPAAPDHSKYMPPQPVKESVATAEPESTAPSGAGETTLLITPEPAIPEVPTAPVAEPAAPSAPEVPTAPMAEPVAPVLPVVPAAPVAEPVAPAVPVVPAAPAAPVAPAPQDAPYMAPVAPAPQAVPYAPAPYTTPAVPAAPAPYMAPAAPVDTTGAGETTVLLNTDPVVPAAPAAPVAPAPQAAPYMAPVAPAPQAVHYAPAPYTTPAVPAAPAPYMAPAAPVDTTGAGETTVLLNTDPVVPYAPAPYAAPAAPAPYTAPAAPVAPEPYIVQPFPAVTEAFTVCRGCGYESPDSDGLVFCPKCGTPLR